MSAPRLVVQTALSTYANAVHRLSRLQQVDKLLTAADSPHEEDVIAALRRAIIATKKEVNALRADLLMELSRAEIEAASR